MMAVITMGSDDDSLRLDRVDSFYIHVGGVGVRLDLPYAARDSIGAHGNGQTKNITTRRTNQRQIASVL